MVELNTLHMSLLKKKMLSNYRRGTVLLALTRILGLGFRIEMFFDYLRHKSKARSILRIMSSRRHDRVVLICLDNYCSPPTYADFLEIVMLLRLFQTNGFEVLLFIVNDSFRLDWKFASVEAFIGYLTDQECVAKKILGMSNVKTGTYHDLTRLLNASDRNYILPFKTEHEERLQVYKECLYSLHFLYDWLGGGRSFLLDEIDFSKVRYPESRRYIVVQVRSNSSWDKWHDIAQPEYIKIISELRLALEPTTDILIVSSGPGTERLKQWSSQIETKVAFSKDYGPSFLDDLQLILNAAFYLQLGGGGMHAYVAYSGVPCLFTTLTQGPKELELLELRGYSSKGGKFKPWSLPSQRYVDPEFLVQEFKSMYCEHSA